MVNSIIIDTVPLRMLVCNISKICGIDQYVTTTEVKECNERNVPNNQTKFSTITVPEAEESIPSITYKDHNSMEISTNRCITTNDAIIAGVIPSVVFMILIALIAVVIICFFCKRKRQGRLIILRNTQNHNAPGRYLFYFSYRFSNFKWRTSCNWTQKL